VSPKRDPVPRARSPLQWLGGILLLGVLAAGVVAAGVRLWQDIDIQRLTSSAALAEPHTVPAALLPNAPAVAQQAYEAALFYSPSSRSFFPDSQYYPDQLDQWERLIGETGGRVTRVSSAAEIEALSGNELLVAASAVCLRREEVTALRNHAERGGGLLVTWAAGARDSNCEWLGWHALRTLTGAAEIRELRQREALYFTVPAGTPLSLGFDPGTRVELRYESQLAAATDGPRTYWSDWALNATPADANDAVHAAATTGWTESGGRIVWFGFRLGHGARPEDNQRMSLLLSNGLRWAAQIPMAEITAWPGGSRSALMISQDVESQFGNAVALADLARRKSARVSFFVVSQMALDFPEVADSLKLAGEIGSQTSDHTILAGLAYNDLRPRLGRSWAEIRGWTGDSAYGLHPPEERFDENTLRAWREVGGTYLLAVNESRTASPEVFATPAGEIVLLPRILKDDYNVFVQEGALRSMRLTEAYLEGMAKARALGGLAVISTRSQVGGVPSRVRVVGEVIDSARATGGWWIASGRDISDWWLARRESGVQMRGTVGGGVEITVTAPMNSALAGAWLEIILPGLPQNWLPTANGQPIQYFESDWGIRIPIEQLLAGEEAAFVVLREASQTSGG